LAGRGNLISDMDAPATWEELSDSKKAIFNEKAESKDQFKMYSDMSFIFQRTFGEKRMTDMSDQEFIHFLEMVDIQFEFEH
jgi:hypothetical protein